jgi:tetratricopeptide (TPR) repeat protein
MRQETNRDSLAAIRSDPGFKQLVQAVALGEGFQLLIVINDSPAVALKALEFLEKDGSLLTGKPAKIILLDPYSSPPSDAQGNLTGERLNDSILLPLVHPQIIASSEKCILAINGSGASTVDESAWRMLFRSMNERRNSIMSRVKGAILLCVTPGLYQAFAEEASDFWSIRSAVITLATPIPLVDFFEKKIEKESLIVSPSNNRWMLSSSGVLAETIVQARERSEALPNDQSAARSFALLLMHWGDSCRTRGDSKGALLAYKEAAKVNVRLAALNTDRADYQQDLSVSYERVGDLYTALGQEDLAREAHLKSLAIRERLAKEEPDRADYQQNLSISYIKMGDRYRAFGQGDLAREAFLKSLAIAERLAKGEPDRADYQRNISISYERVGDLYRTFGQGDLAREAFLESLAIRERLTKEEPDRADYQRDLFVSYTKMGDLYTALGQGDLAKEAYLKSLAITERLVKEEPDRADYQRDLSISYERVGDLYPALGQGDLAREAYLKSLTIRERLAKEEPDRADYQRDLSVSYIKMGDLYRALGQGDLAREAYLKSLAIAERLAKEEPDRADYQRDLVISLVNTSGANSSAAINSHLLRALEILVFMKNAGQLDPVDEPMIPAIEKMLSEDGEGR